MEGFTKHLELRNWLAENTFSVFFNRRDEESIVGNSRKGHSGTHAEKEGPSLWAVHTLKVGLMLSLWALSASSTQVLNTG